MAAALAAALPGTVWEFPGASSLHLQSQNLHAPIALRTCVPLPCFCNHACPYPPTHVPPIPGTPPLPCSSAGFAQGTNPACMPLLSII